MTLGPFDVRGQLIAQKALPVPLLERLEEAWSSPPAVEGAGVVPARLEVLIGGADGLVDDWGGLAAERVAEWTPVQLGVSSYGLTGQLRTGDLVWLSFEELE